MANLAIVFLAVFSGASFLFALAETALFSLGPWRARRLSAQPGGAGHRVVELLGQPEDLLATIALGNTLSNAAIVATALMMSLEGIWTYGLSIPVALLLVLVGGEVVPKALGVRDPERWSGLVARPMAWIVRVSRPLRQGAQRWVEFLLARLVPRVLRPMGDHSLEDYRELLDVAFQEGALAKNEKETILQILNLDRRMAQNVMRPRSRMVSIPDDLSLDEMMEHARRLKYRRLPMYDETPDTIVGVLNTRTLLLDPTVDLADAIEFPSFVPATMNLLQLFKSLQQQQRGLAIVLDEFGGTAGLITMEDILEEMVGTFHRQPDEEGLIMERLEPGRWRVSGTMRVDDFARECPPLGVVEDVETLGGLMVDRLGVVPAAGDRLVFRGIQLTAKVVDERRVRELWVEQVRRRPPGPASRPAGGGSP